MQTLWVKNKEHKGTSRFEMGAKFGRPTNVIEEG
jgi:hypothetical protein